MRVDLSPIICTVPDTPPTTTKSPTSNGLSTAMASDAKMSAKMFCTASATAMPPTPRLAIKAVMFTPTLDRMASTTTLHSRVRRLQDISVADALTCVIPLDECRATYRRTPAAMARMPHSPNCSATATNHSWLNRFSHRPGKSSMPAPSNTATISNRKRLVPSRTSINACAPLPSDRATQTFARPVRTRKVISIAKYATTATPTASIRFHNGTPAKVVFWIQWINRDVCMRKSSSS